MHPLWLKGYKDKEERKEKVLSYRTALTDLKEILEKEVLKKEAVRDYTPGWEHKQIATNEYNAALADLIKLLDIKD